MGRGGRTGSNRRSNKHVRMRKSVDSEDSDEDYVAEADEVEEQSDELDSFVRDSSEEESCFEEDEEQDGLGDDDEDDCEWRTVSKTSTRRGSSRSRKNKTIRPKKRRRKVTCDDEEDSDDDDDEFTLDEVESLEEEEEFPPPRTTVKKRGRTTLKRKTPARGRRRKQGVKYTRKSLNKKSRKTGTCLRKAKSEDDEDFAEKGPTLRDRNKTKPVRRKRRRVTVGLDSDPSSDSSDFEFTISEEEREQIREASNICRSLTPNLRSSRRIQDDEAVCEPRKPPARKGKEKAEEKKVDVGKQVCGICLTEEGKNSIRGTLNCCSHYFCFACIMEWSKVESRCPLCKQRFITISKPLNCYKGFDLRNSVIQVPERDQVYQPSEEELRDFLNPYENVICTECRQGGDDALMLLCDVCDSPAHTYCVGLGREVPEGNWYCDGCRSVTQDLTPDQRTNFDAYGYSTYENMAEIDLNVTIPETPVGSFQAQSPVSGTGATTLFGRRRIHRQIHHILYNRQGQAPPNAESNTRRSALRPGDNSTFEHSETSDVGTSRHAVHVDRYDAPSSRYQENLSHNTQNRDLRGQLHRDSPSVDFSSHSHMQRNGLNGINYGAGRNHISSGEQLGLCTNRSNIGSGMGASPLYDRDEGDISVFIPQYFPL